MTPDTARSLAFSDFAGMTPALEAAIGKDMKARAMAEGHRPAYPKSPNPAFVDVVLARAHTEAAVYRALAQHGELTLGAVRNCTSKSHHSVNLALAMMVSDGRVLERDNGRHNRGGTISHTYRINPDYAPITPHSPLSGDCDPALPGNPVAGPVPSIVTKPPGSDRPGGVETRA
jgi:hypothetical protein